MNWEAIGAIGQVIGSVAVLFTLVYLAIQVKRANELSQFSSAKEIVNLYNDLNRMVTTDSELRGVLMKRDELTEDEREQTYNFAMMFCNVWVSVQVAYDNRQIDGSLYAACAKDVRIEIDRWPSFRAAAKRWLSNYPENQHHPILRPILESYEDS